MLEIVIKNPNTSEQKQMKNFIFLRKCFLQKNMYHHDGSSLWYNGKLHNFLITMLWKKCPLQRVLQEWFSKCSQNIYKISMSLLKANKTAFPTLHCAIPFSFKNFLSWEQNQGLQQTRPRMLWTEIHILMASVASNKNLCPKHRPLLNIWEQH